MRIRNLFDPGSGIRDGKIRIWDKHPGSATLTATHVLLFSAPTLISSGLRIIFIFWSGEGPAASRGRAWWGGGAGGGTARPHSPAPRPPSHQGTSRSGTSSSPPLSSRPVGSPSHVGTHSSMIRAVTIKNMRMGFWFRRGRASGSNEGLRGWASGSDEGPRGRASGSDEGLHGWALVPPKGYMEGLLVSTKGGWMPDPDIRLLYGGRVH